MTDVCPQKKDGSEMKNRIQFNVKPIVVHSKNLVTSIKALNNLTFNEYNTTMVIFDVQAMSGGYYMMLQ